MAIEKKVIHEHFVARLVVERVQHVREEQSSSSFSRGTEPLSPTERVVDELTSVTVKQSALDDLKQKLTAHVDLISDLED